MGQNNELEVGKVDGSFTMNPELERIDKINQMLECLKSQTGAIAFITNPQHSEGEMSDISDFFYGLRNQIDNVIALVNEIPVEKSKLN